MLATLSLSSPKYLPDYAVGELLTQAVSDANLPRSVLVDLVARMMVLLLVAARDCTDETISGIAEVSYDAIVESIQRVART